MNKCLCYGEGQVDIHSGHMYKACLFDAIVVGSGPNGLAAAVTLARAGLQVKVLEAEAQIGGGARTTELTLPGFQHDVCSAMHPMALASPFFRSLPLSEFGLEWIRPPYALAHPLLNEPAVILHGSPQDTAAELGDDGEAYRVLFEPIVSHWEALVPQWLAPLVRFPATPLRMAHFGLQALRSARSLARRRFKTPRAQALFSGLAAHGMMPLEKAASAAVGLVLGTLGHAVGWPLARGGSRRISEALAGYLIALGGKIETGCRVESLDQVTGARAILFDLTPRQILSIAGPAIPARYARKLERYRYGPGVFKLDLALNGPIPWRQERCAKAGTVHVGGTLEEIGACESAVHGGNHPDHPFVLVGQQSLFDVSRAPAGKHTVWAYCHVPNGSCRDMTVAIESQIERHAPGFRDCIISRHTMNAQQMEQYDTNYVGGDINGGVQDIGQMFGRPAGPWNPYHIPGTRLYICSSSSPPGGGVHGMCGYHAARAAMRREFDSREAGLPD